MNGDKIRTDRFLDYISKPPFLIKVDMENYFKVLFHLWPTILQFNIKIDIKLFNFDLSGRILQL